VLLNRRFWTKSCNFNDMSIFVLNLIIIFFLSLGAQAAEQCSSLFAPEFSHTGFQSTDYAQVKTIADLEQYVKYLSKKNTDIQSLVWAIEETEPARYWYYSDIIIFLNRMNVRTDIFNSPNHSLHYDDAKTRFDAYVLVRRGMTNDGRTKEQMHSLLKITPYFRNQKLSEYQLDHDIDNLIDAVVKFKENFNDKAKVLPLLQKRIMERSEALTKASKTMITRDQVIAKFYQILYGEGTNEVPDLELYWSVNTRTSLRKVPDRYMYLRYEKAGTYKANPFDEGRPYHIANHFMGHKANTSKFYENLYQNYEGRVREDLIQLVKSTEDSLPQLRQSYGLINDTVTDPFTTIGTIRVFDGTPQHTEDSYFNGLYAPGQRGPYNLPFEVFFKARKIPVKYIETLNKMRTSDPFAPIFEIGRFSLEGSGATRERAAKAIDLFLYDYYLRHYPTATFVVHVTSEAHLKLYQRRYGFEIAEAIAVPDSKNVEYILTITAENFKKAIEKRLEIIPNS
jgi:hypothetical protein